MKLTADQRRAISFGERDGRHIHFGGAMRSGKTWCGIWGFLYWAGSNFTGHDFVIATKGQTQFQSTLLKYMKDYAAAYDLVLTRMDRCWRLESDDGGWNDFYVVLYQGTASGGTGSDGGALPASRIEGTGFAGAFIDETLECPQIMLDTLRTRCSVPGAKLVYSYFPQSEHHPFKTSNYDKVESGELSGETHHLAMEDNPSLTPEYIAEEKAMWEPFPHEYARRIKGMWASGDGLVYEKFEDQLIVGPSKEVMAEMTYWDAIVDWAPESVSYGLLMGYHAGHNCWYAAREWIHDGRVDAPKTTETKIIDMVAMLSVNGTRRIRTWIIDPNEDGVRVELRRLGFNVMDAENDNDKGIKIAGVYLHSGRMRISRLGVPRLVKEMAMYSWDKKAMRRGVTKADKASADGAHACDCFRYFCLTHSESAASRTNVMRHNDVNLLQPS